ncbi:MAG TPA: redox-regulated ATPase YchF, partial [Devosia sp.]|nr:redox-regulated ATPase YchF [Devosia sp.]
CFEDSNLIHVANKVDPIADAEVVETELMLADLESLEKRRTGVEKKAKQGDKEAKLTLDLIDRSLALLREGKSARLVQRSSDEEKAFRELQLLTSKPALYVCNVDEASAATGNDMSRQVEAYAKQHDAAVIVISAEIESQLAQLPDAEQAEYLESLGLSEPGLNRLIQQAYQLLGLQTYFTAGPKEARAWTIHKGDRAPQAAGVIHTDFERGFIRAQTIAYDDYVALGGEVPAKEAGKARDEGKDYVVKDGDVMLFKFNT